MTDIQRTKVEERDLKLKKSQGLGGQKKRICVKTGRKGDTRKKQLVKLPTNFVVEDRRMEIDYQYDKQGSRKFRLVGWMGRKNDLEAAQHC